MQPIYKIFVKIDKRFQNEIETESGLRLYKDTSFRPEENSTIVGDVVAVPDKYDRAMGSDQFKANVIAGDKLYFNFLVTVDEENRIEVDGEEYWMVDYFNAIALVRDGGLIPVGDYILIEPIDEKIESTLIIPDTVDREGNRGRVVASNDESIPNGSLVEYEEVGKFWNIIEGKRVYCMYNQNILFLYND
jgi:co-chaperonin GroES (HSP10)